mmetsp:Transcript_31484/g.86631  ORF Transcript_31484/g.86631 Transcript_31484/m.86631 type:complete len:87 (+) Transcript_31484:1249-1509(+)
MPRDGTGGGAWELAPVPQHRLHNTDPLVLAEGSGGAQGQFLQYEVMKRGSKSATYGKRVQAEGRKRTLALHSTGTLYSYSFADTAL